MLKKRELQAAELKKSEGSHYQLVIRYIEKTLGDIKRVHPEYDPEQGCEIAGFVCFQGWNDMAAPAGDPEFKHTVKAVQTADYWDEQFDRLNKIASEANQKRQEFTAEKDLKGEALEKALADYEATVWTPEEKAIHAAGVSNQGFHYLGSAKMIGQFGKAFAEAVLELQPGKITAEVI